MTFKKYAVTFSMNGEEKTFINGAVSTSAALYACWAENALEEEGGDSYIPLLVEDLGDWDEENDTPHIWDGQSDETNYMKEEV